MSFLSDRNETAKADLLGSTKDSISCFVI